MIASSSRRGLSMIGNGIVKKEDIPLFLCPILADGRAQSSLRPRVRRLRPTMPIRQIASTSAAIIAIPHHDESAHQGTSTWKRLPSPTIDTAKTTSRRSRKDEALQQLSFIEETLDDLLKRPNHFQSGFEKIFMLLEAKHDLEEIWDSKDVMIRRKIQGVAPKLALEMVKLSKPEQSLKVLQMVSAAWSKEEEVKFRDAWQPVVKQMMSLDLQALAIGTMKTLCKLSGLSDDWLSRLFLQLHLKSVESNDMTEDDVKVDNWWEAYEDNGIPVPRFVTSELLESQIRRCEYDKIQATLQAMERIGHHIDPSFWRQCIWPALRLKRMKNLFNAFITCTEDVRLVAEDLMIHYGRSNNLKECLRVMRRFKLPILPYIKINSDVIIKPTMLIYGVLIDLLTRKGQADHAKRFLDIAREHKCEGNYLHAYLRLNAVLEKQGRHRESFIIALQLLNLPWQEILSDQTPVLTPVNYRFMHPSQPLYSKLLYILSQTRDNGLIVPAARMLLLDILSRGKPFSDALRHRLVLIVRQIGYRAPVLRLDTYLKRLFALRDDVDDRRRKEWDDFVQYFLKGGGIDDYKVIEYEKSRKAYSDAEEKGKNVLPEDPLLKQQEATRNTSSSLGIAKDAVKLEDQMHEDSETEPQLAMPSPSPNVTAAALDLSSDLSGSAYALRIRVFAIIRKDFNTAFALFNHMLKRGIRPTASHIGPLVEGLVLNGYVKEAFEVKERAMIALPGKKLSAVCYSALARGLGQVGKWRAVLSIADEMRDFDLKVSRTLKDLFQVAVKILNERKASLKLQSPLEYRRKEGSRDDIRGGGILPQLLPESYDVDSVFRRFGYFHQRGQFDIAQKQVTKALQRGLVADSRLRKALDRSENLLRKTLTNAQSTNRSTRRIKSLQVALDLCNDNRAKVKASSKDLDNLNEIYNRDSERRQEMVNLIKDALTSENLFEEAQQMRAKKTEQKNTEQMQAL